MSFGSSLWRGKGKESSKDASKISQLRTISFLSVEGQIFFAVLARRLKAYMSNNGYFSAKRRVLEFSRCLEHTSAISHLNREAKINHGDLTAIWLELENADGPVRHSLIMEAVSLP